MFIDVNNRLVYFVHVWFAYCFIHCLTVIGVSQKIYDLVVWVMEKFEKHCPRLRAFLTLLFHKFFSLLKVNDSCI